MDEKADSIADGTAARRWDAFLSYSSRDATIAGRVQRFLERYRLPDGRRLRIYRDETDISGGELPEQLRAALAASSSLLVCCSEAAVKSAWVSREIEAFRELAPGQPVLPVILADDPPENLPAPLCDIELRWADLRSGWRLGRPRRKTRVELIRAVAAAAEVDFRELLPLDRQRRRRHRLLVSVAIAAVLMAVAWWPLGAAGRRNRRAFRKNVEFGSNAWCPNRGRARVLRPP
ncbi:toll/interleukin-1 receptor domain-containing protein [Sedimenticola hydrogenitrophicus]|uniref:toll/interleukin-1 receptor domain-containing protein n=1 Tax=Sedimenticola hydrogenitrophicus TaxID=2967975 RepID=UPI0023AED964